MPGLNLPALLSPTNNLLIDASSFRCVIAVGRSSLFSRPRIFCSKSLDLFAIWRMVEFKTGCNLYLSMSKADVSSCCPSTVWVTMPLPYDSTLSSAAEP